MDAKEKMGLFGKENKLDEAQLSKMVSEGVKEAIKEQLASMSIPPRNPSSVRPLEIASPFCWKSIFR